MAVVTVGGAPVAGAVTRGTDVTFAGSGGTALYGTVLAPRQAGRHPALVLVPGAGPTKRAELRLQAEAFAERGIVTLIYDKRTEGYSSFHRDYSVLAEDALAGVRTLRARADVDPGRVGVWGLSEGAWVASLAAARSADVAKVVTVGAVGLSPSRQQAWAYGQYLRHGGVRGSLPGMMQDTGIRQLVGAGLFPEATYDPVPVWERVGQPVLNLWGTLDREAAPAESARIIGAALDRGGNRHHLTRFVPDARHNLHITSDNGFDRPDPLAPGGADMAAAFVKGEPVAPGALRPEQDGTSRELAPLAWYENGWGQLAALALFALAFLGHPVAAAVRRLRGTAPLPTRRPARTLAALGATTVLGCLAYFAFMALTAANLVGPTLLGRPLLWLLLQLLATATVAATAFTAISFHRHHAGLAPGTRAHLWLQLSAGAVFIPWAAYWGLLLP
ncbi:alpha/beta hydrolase family protein [Streptomyces luteireticuli]|uniref:alpha/beta hydrolase family protein n=1 Tax=Streptomyces luteireticuli TaxID=173858 RepID=UPI003557002D